jgi:hypothetical protein
MGRRAILVAEATEGRPIASASAFMSAGIGASIESSRPVRGCRNETRHECSAWRGNFAAISTASGSTFFCP